MSFIKGKSMVVTLMKFGCLCEKVLMKLSVFRLQFVTMVFYDLNFLYLYRSDESGYKILI